MANDLLFGRKARVTISIPVSTPGDFTNTTTDEVEINGTDDPDSPGLRITFNIAKTSEKQPNTSEIDVYNLSDTRRASLQQKGVKVRLEAGYQSTGLSRLFLGDVRTVDHVREQGDWKTILKLGDGERSFQNARANASFKAGTGAGDVLKYLANQSGLEVGNLPTEAANVLVTFDQGYTVNGLVSKSLDRLVRSLGLTWSIQDGALQVLSESQSLDISIPEISPDTGLVDSPEMGSPEKKGKPALVKFRSLLVPTRPGALVQLKSKRYDGKVRVKKCTFTGDTMGKDWFVVIEGVLQQ